MVRVQLLSENKFWKTFHEFESFSIVEGFYDKIVGDIKVVLKNIV